jgi:tRNA nucleotidyltransferase (CCA-adding enzyme)
LADPVPFDISEILSELPIPSYFVGGWVRDKLLAKMAFGLKNKPKPKLDLDLVMPNLAVETARLIARQYGAGFVLLDAERQIARVVFAHCTVDFARQMGDTIVEDLSRRDFCMNAIALDCLHLSQLPLGLEAQNLDNLIDPFDGQGDLHRRQVRMVSPENLQSDPLRILRGYRQAAQLGFDFEPLTQATAIQLSSGLAGIAAERITAELVYLLAHPDGTNWLITAISDRILLNWLPPNILELVRFSKIDASIAQLKNYFPELNAYFSKNLAGDRSIEITTKLAALVDGMPQKLELSKAEQRFGITLLRYLRQFKSQLNHTTAQVQYQLFQSTGQTFPALVALAIADGINEDQAFCWLRQWLDPNDPIAHPLVLVTGDELKLALNLPASPKIGELLAQIRIAQVEGLIDNKPDAIAYAAKLIAK